jgi:hypothetical protein
MTESFLGLLRDTHTARKHDPSAISKRQYDCLAEIVAFARTKSPYYRELYRRLSVTNRGKCQTDRWCESQASSVCPRITPLLRPE